MSSYVVKDTELTSVANAIRTKGGTSSSLVFPNGFVSAIGNISGGGSSDFSTAEVTIVVNVPTYDITIPTIIENDDHAPDCIYIETNAQDGTYTVPLYKGTAIGAYYGSDSLTFSGGIEMIEDTPMFFITGNGTITVSKGIEMA